MTFKKLIKSKKNFFFLSPSTIKNKYQKSKKKTFLYFFFLFYLLYGIGLGLSAPSFTNGL